MSKKYEKPKITSPGSTPEPIESGCCLTSCGGSPGGLQAGRNTAGATELLEKVKEIEAEAGINTTA